MELSTIIRRDQRDQKPASYSLIARHGGIAKSTPFMRFWKTMNDVLKSRDLPQMQYGEAKDWWKDHQGWEG